MDWARALEISQALGFAVAMIFRFTPGLKNTVAPKAAFVTTLLVNVVALWQKFVESAGLGMAFLFPDYTSDIAYAGFFGAIKGVVGGLATVAMPVVISFAQTALNRGIWELGGKAVTNGKPPSF